MYGVYMYGVEQGGGHKFYYVILFNCKQYTNTLTERAREGKNLDVGVDFYAEEKLIFLKLLYIYFLNKI